MNDIINVTKPAVEANIARLSSCLCEANDFDFNEELKSEIKAFKNLLVKGSNSIGGISYVLSGFTTKGFGFPV